MLAKEHFLTLAVLSPSLVVIEASEKFREYQQDPSIIPIGKPVNEVLWEFVGAEEALQDILAGKSEVFIIQNANRGHPDGSITYLLLKVVSLSKDAPGDGLLLIIEDTTSASKMEQAFIQERNELRLTRNHLAAANEELRKLDRLKSLVLSFAAHDFRTPLSAIMGYTELVTKSLPRDSSKEIMEFLAAISSLADTLNRLTTDFLALGALEQGSLRINPIPCDLNKMVIETAEHMRSNANDKNITIVLETTPDLPLISADPDRLQQILFNLINNAIKYTNQGGQIKIKTGKKGNTGYFCIADNGPGIPKSELPKIFDLYHRTESAQQSRAGGLGLGLYIVKSLVDLHHGQITVRSAPGKGTEFTVNIPLVG